MTGGSVVHEITPWEAEWARGPADGDCGQRRVTASLLRGQRAHKRVARIAIGGDAGELLLGRIRSITSWRIH